MRHLVKIPQARISFRRIVLPVLAGLLMLLPVRATAGSLDFTLPKPESADHCQYLGLSSNEAFSIGQIRAPFVLVQIFSMYCPICQREAKTVNRLYDRIRADESLKGRIRLIGIGAGNTEFEVDFYRKTYDIQFPLFSDGDFTIHKQVGEKGTPYFIGAKILPDQTLDIVFTHSGDIKDPDGFLDRLAQQAGLKGAP